MGLSSTLTISSEADGYTLAELLDLLGSPKKLKEALGELEAASKHSTKLAKDLAKAESQRQAAVLADTQAKLAMQEECDVRVAKAEAAEARLVVAKNNKKTELAQALADANEKLEAANAKETDLSTREAALKRKESNVDKEYARMEDINDAAQKEIAKDMKAAEKYRQQALKIRREADDKVEAMKKLVA
jgi:hypothetical protein